MVPQDRILVTGGTGFVGGHLVKRFVQKGLPVYWMSSDNYGLATRSGLTQKGSHHSPQVVVDVIKEMRPTRVFHLATHFRDVHTPADIQRLTDACITFGTAVAEASAVCGARFIYVESAWQRYMGKKSSVSLYAALKNAFDEVLNFYAEVHALETVGVFLFDTYGPSDKRGKLVTRLLSALFRDESLTLGSPDKLINLTHVHDVVTGLVSVSEWAPKRDWVIKPWSTISLAELVAEVERVAEKSLNVRWDPSLDRPREMRSDWIFGSLVAIENPLCLRDGLQMEWNRGSA